MDIEVLKIVVALAPVSVCLAAFVLLDVFKLMSLKEIGALLAGGAVLAAASYLANWRAMDELPIGFTDYSRWIAPVVEETLKGLLIVGLFAFNRIGYLVDAAIAGFAVGAGFSLAENLFYLHGFIGANLGVWLVRGFGTGVMHGGATAILAASAQALFAGRLRVAATGFRLNPLLFLPGLAGAIALHAAFNHFPNEPVAAMAVVLLAVPLTLFALFALGERRAHAWLAEDRAAHVRLLDDIRSGAFAGSEGGRALRQLGERLGEAGAKDLDDYVRLNVELVVRAEGTLIAHQEHEQVALPPDVREAFQRLHALEKRLGRAVALAVRTPLKFSRNDLWEMHELEEDT